MAEKNGPVGGHFRVSRPFWLVVPVMPLDNYRAVPVAVIPPMMPAAIMAIKLGGGSGIVTVAIVAAVVAVADMEVKPLCTCNRRRRNRKGRQSGENARKLSHLSLLRCCIQRKTNGRRRRSGNIPGTFLNRCSA